MTHEKVYKLLKPLILLLAIACVFTFISLLVSLHDDFETYSYEEDNLYYYLENKHYISLCRGALVNEAVDVELSEDQKALCAIGKYYLNSFFYNALKDTDNFSVAPFQERMEQSKEDTGIYSYAIEDIDAMFE